MGRFLAGALAALGLAGAGLFLWQAVADAPGPADQFPPRPAPPAARTDPAPQPTPALGFVEPPEASPASREQKRFHRYDHNRNGTIDRNEYLLNRHRAFGKLDRNRDGLVSFDEYAAAAAAKFAKADNDGNGLLDAREFATTRTVRKVKPRKNCPPAPAAPGGDPEASE